MPLACGQFTHVQHIFPLLSGRSVLKKLWVPAVAFKSIGVLRVLYQRDEDGLLYCFNHFGIEESFRRVCTP